MASRQLGTGAQEPGERGARDRRAGAPYGGGDHPRALGADRGSVLKKTRPDIGAGRDGHGPLVGIGNHDHEIYNFGFLGEPPPKENICLRSSFSFSFKTTKQRSTLQSKARTHTYIFTGLVTLST